MASYREAVLQGKIGRVGDPVLTEDGKRIRHGDTCRGRNGARALQLET